MEARNKRWSDEEFFQVRKEVLAQWPTGKEVEDLSEGIDYCKALPWWKRWPDRQERMRKAGKIPIIAFIGDTTFERTVEHIEYCEEYAPDCWVALLDPCTRKNKYREAEEALALSYKEDRITLVGFPVVNYGVKYVRQLNESTASAIWTDANDEDPRLAVEIQMAGGGCGYISQSLHEVLMHSKDYPPDKRILNAQYIDRLAAYYTERGAPMHAIVLGNLPGWDTPGFKVVIPLLHVLLAAEQGVKRMTTHHSTTMNLLQDVATLRAARELGLEYLAKMGHSDVQLWTSNLSTQSVWPRDVDRTAAMAAWAVAIAILGGADSFQIRALDEAFNIATKERHLSALKIARQMLLVLANQRLPENKELEIEKQMIKTEVRAVVDKVFELGDGDVAVGMVKAVELGVLDTCFSPWRHLKNNVLTMKDGTNAVRYYDHGTIPLPKEVIEYNRAKLDERSRVEGINIDMDVVIKDVTRLSQPIPKTEDICYNC